MKRDSDTYVDDLFKMVYCKAYNNILQPMSSKNLWDKVPGNTVLPPQVRRQAWRPKKQRKRDQSERDPTIHVFSRKCNQVKCSTCKQYCHNSRFCKDKGKQTVSTSNSQVRKRGRPRKIDVHHVGAQSIGAQAVRTQSSAPQRKSKLQVRMPNTIAAQTT